MKQFGQTITPSAFGQTITPTAFGQKVNPSGFNPNNRAIIKSQPSGKVGNPLAIAGAIIPAVAGLIGSVYQARQQRKLAQEQNDYNRRMVDEQNAYNSPEAQKARLLDAGFTDKQAMDMLYGSPSSAVGQQTAVPEATDLTDNVPNFGQIAMEGANSAITAGHTMAETDSIYQDVIQKQIMNEYQEQIFVKTLRDLDDTHDAKVLANFATTLNNNMLHENMDAISYNLQCSLAKSIFENSPFVNMFSTERAKILNNRIKQLRQGSENDIKLAEFMQKMLDFKNENTDLYTASEAATLGLAPENLRHTKKTNKLTERGLSYEVGTKGIEYDIFKRNKAIFENAWIEGYNASISANHLQATKDTYEFMAIEDEAQLYLEGIISSWKNNNAHDKYNAMIYDFLSTKTGQDFGKIRNLFSNYNSLIGLSVPDGLNGSAPNVPKLGFSLKNLRPSLPIH